MACRTPVRRRSGRAVRGAGRAGMAGVDRFGYWGGHAALPASGRRRVGAGVLRRVPGQGQEHLVQAGQPQPELGGHDAGRRPAAGPAPTAWPGRSPRPATRPVSWCTSGRDPGDLGHDGRHRRGRAPGRPPGPPASGRRSWPSARPACPSATTRPWSMTTIWSASSSASSRYWVVSSTVAPSATTPPDGLPDLVARPRVQPGGRLVQEQHLGVAEQAGGQVEPAAHAAGVGLDRPPGRVGQLEPLEHLAGPAAGRRPAQAEQPADHDAGSRSRSARRPPRRTGRSAR